MLSMAVAVGGSAARAAPTEVAAAATAPVDAGSGFHLEGKPEIDDVFGDASDYRRTIDRFLELATQMQAMRDEFARSVQVGAHRARRARRRPVEKKPTAQPARLSRSTRSRRRTRARTTSASSICASVASSRATTSRSRSSIGSASRSG